MAEHVAKKMKEKLHLNQLLTVGQIAALADEEIRTIAKQAEAQKRIGYTTLSKQTRSCNLDWAPALAIPLLVTAY
jgi:hypothetical protein